MADVSLISSLASYPFGTEERALTIYNCTSQFTRYYYTSSYCSACIVCIIAHKHMHACSPPHAVQPQLEFSLPNQPADMKVDSSGQVFLGVNNHLLRLDRNLTILENVTFGSNNILKIALSSDENRLVVCFNNESCAVYNASDLNGGSHLSIEEAAASSFNVALFTTMDDTFYVGSYGSLPSTTNIVLLTQHGFGHTTFTRSSGVRFSSQTSALERNFYHGFVRNMNAYHFVIDSTPNEVRGVRALRMCHIEECTGSSSVCEVDALYETQLTCSGLSVTGSEICGVSLLNNTLVIVSVCGDRNHICSFSLEEIDTAMDYKYTECSSGTGSIELAWGGQSRTCSGDFTVRLACF